MLKDKRGFVYFVEIALSVLILMFIFDGFLESDQRVFENKQLDNLRWQAWGSLNVLYELDLLTSNLNQEEFGDLDVYIQNSLLGTQDYDWEFYNSTGCYPIDDQALGSPASQCVSINAQTEKDIVSSLYTVANANGTSSLRLYLWDKL